MAFNLVLLLELIMSTRLDTYIVLELQIGQILQ